jgi:hypothetical protein
MNLTRFLDLVTSRGGKSAGAIRVSLGLAATSRTRTVSSSSPRTCAIRHVSRSAA